MVLDLNLRILNLHFPAREECRSRAIAAETRLDDPDAVHEDNMNFDSIEWSPSSSGTTVVFQGQGSSVVATQPCSSILPASMNQPPVSLDQTGPPPGLTLPFKSSVPRRPPGLPLPLQLRVSSPTSIPGLALLNSPLRPWSPMQSSDSFPFTPPRNSFLNQLDAEGSPSEPVSSTTALKSVPPFLNQESLMVEPLTKEKGGKRPGGETLLESRKKRRKQSVPLAEKSPSKVASPPRPKAHPKPQKMATATRLSSSLTCAPSARKRRSGECPPDDRGDINDAAMRQKTSSTRLPDPVAQDACKLFLSVDFGEAWMDALRHFQDFETLHPSNSKARLKSVYRPICVHEWIKRGRSATY